MTPTRLMIALLLLFQTVLYSYSNTPIKDGWNELYANRFDEARASFGNALQDTETTGKARLGIVLCDLAQGDAYGLTGSLQELIVNHTDSPYLATFLAVMDISDLQGWSASGRLEVLEAALKNAKDQSAKQEINNRLANVHSMLLLDKTKTTAKNAGVILNHWNVIGPFGEFGTPDFFHAFGPELEIKNSYQGWREEVSFQPLEKSHHNGWIEFNGLIIPRSGVAYAVNVVEAESDGTLNFTVESSADIRVWWNGKPWADKTSLHHEYSNAFTGSVHVKKGKNLLLVKTTDNGRWNLRARLHHRNDTVNWKSVAFNPSDFSALYIEPFGTLTGSWEYDVPVTSRYTPNMAEFNQPAWHNLLMALWHSERHEYVAALQNLEQAKSKAESFAYLHSLEGEINLALAAERPASKPRYQQAAEAALNRALENDPVSKKAVVGLISYYLDRDQTDQALEVLNEVEDTHPQVREGYTGLLDYSRALLYARKGFEHEASKLMLKANTPLLTSLQIPNWMYNFYTGHHQTKKAKEIAFESMELMPGYLPFINLAIRSVSSAEEEAKVADVLKKSISAYPQNLEYGLALGRLYELQGKLEEAKDLYTKLKQHFPNHTQPLNQLAEVNTLLAGSNDTKSYEALYAMNPSSGKSLRMLRDAEGKEFPFQKYDVHMEDIDVSVAERWNNTRASAIYLIDMMVLTLHPNGTYDQYIHQAIKILNQEGVRQWAEVVMPQGGNTEIIYGRTINPDGSEWAVSHLQDLGGQQSLSMYGIEEGSIIEFAYLQRAGIYEPGSNVYSGGYFFGAENDHMLLSKLTVVRHKDVPYNIDVNGEINTKITEDGDYIIYDYEKWMSEGIKPERFAPPLSKRVPSLQMTTGVDWMPFAERMRTTVYPFEEHSELITNKAKEITDGAETNQASVQRIYDWIRENIEESSGGQTTVDTLMLMAGSRYQKLRLAHQMLGAVGVRSDIVVALENDEGDGFRPLPFPNYPSTSLLVVPEQPGIGNRIVIDFSSRFSPLNQINPQLQEQVALVLDERTPYFEPLLPKSWDHGELRKFVELTLHDEEPAEIIGQYEYDNGYDEQIRQALTNPEVKQRLADAQVANDLRGIQLDETEIIDDGDLSTAPVLGFKGRLPGIITKNGNHKREIQPVLMKVQASGMVSDTTRESPISFSGSPMYEPLVVDIDMSDYFGLGAKIVVPKNSFIINEFGYYSLFYAWEGKTLKMRRAFLIPDQTVTPEAYPRFVDFCREIDRIEEQAVQIILPVQAG